MLHPISLLFLLLLSPHFTAPLVLSRASFLKAFVTIAITPYDNYAPTYDILDDNIASNQLKFLGLSEGRSKLLSNSYGSVLEICAGTGINLPYYPKNKLKSLTMLDISPNMLKLAEDRVESFPCADVRFDVADVTNENYLLKKCGEQAFDTVVDTFSLCVLDTNTVKTLTLVKRLVKPDGKILLFENSRSDNELVGSYQDLTAKAIAKKGGGGKGCVYNQRVEDLIKEAGLVVESRTDYGGGLFRAFVCIRGGE